jgi:hypothetical protein
MLKLLANIVLSHFHKAEPTGGAALSAWTGWLQEHSKLTGWSWVKWDHYSPGLGLNDSETAQIQAVEVSAEGKLSPETLRQIMEGAEKAPPPP